MCGIAGYVSHSPDAGLSAALRDMADAIAHRGPDDAGYFEVPFGDGHRVGLAHRRLSIIDLSTGHQPLGNEDGSIQIVFNGEVYNFQELRRELEATGHRFSTHSDTETIVHAYEQWGDDCVTRFRGMFAFALWDGPRKRLLLARDRFGKKPLFLYEADGLLLFASEIKSILAFPGVKVSPDETAIWDYFAYRYVPAPATLFQGIRKLMPGCIGVWERGRLVERRYWSPPDREPRAAGSVPEDPIGAFMEHLEEAVRIRMVADVPFGAFLSGGIDSSAVVALMSRHSTLPVKTFSVGFASAGYSELDYARVISQQFRTDHRELTVDAEHLIEQLPALTRYRDAPVAEPTDIPIYLLSREAGKTVKMVLTGEGSDEVLAGYPKHRFERYVRANLLLPGFLRHGLIAPLVHALPYRFHRAKTAVVNLGLERFEERMPRWFGALSGAERQALVALPSPGTKTGEYQFDTSPSNSTLRRILYFDQTSWLPDNLLERGDRMTMAASLEARMPFMDHELAAFVSALPDNFRVRRGTTKWLLREGMKRILPRSILERPKVGFRVPINEWFRTTMRDYLYDHLIGADSGTAHYYHRPALLRVFEEHAVGRQNHEKLLWSMLNLELWWRSYFQRG
jgi:asparagine synthase (glutamine-hydrolysing)